MEYHTAVEKDKPSLHTTQWMGLRNLTLSDKRWTEKGTPYKSSFTLSSRTDENQLHCVVIDTKWYQHKDNQEKDQGVKMVPLSRGERRTQFEMNPRGIFYFLTRGG